MITLFLSQGDFCATATVRPLRLGMCKLDGMTISGQTGSQRTPALPLCLVPLLPDTLLEEKSERLETHI